MSNQYLIPANSKKSMLIFGLFLKGDLILFSMGLAVTVVGLMIAPLDSIIVTTLILAPALVTGFLVMPVPYYYNMRTLLTSAFVFFTSRQKYIWKGWGFLDGKDDKK